MVKDFLGDVTIVVFAAKIERRLCMTIRADFFHKLNCYGCLIVINTQTEIVVTHRVTNIYSKHALAPSYFLTSKIQLLSISAGFRTRV